MTERIEDRLRRALDLLTETPPLPNATRPCQTPARRYRRRAVPLLAAATALVLALVLLVTRLDTGGDDTVRVTGPAPSTTVVATPAAAPAAPTSPRAAYPDAPTVAVSPLTRAMVAFSYGRDGHWTWFVVDGADRRVRAAADLPVTGGARGSGALSPDGLLLAYSVLNDGPGPVPYAPQVVVVRLDDGSETRFASPRAVALAWSPDGSRLAWLEQPPGAVPRLIVADRTGRPRAAVAVAADRQTLAWSPDGSRLVVAGCPSSAVPPTPVCPPSILDLATLGSRDLPQPATSRVAWTPDSREIVVDGFTEGPVLLAADGSGRRTVGSTGTARPIAHLFSQDGAWMLVRPDRAGGTDPYAVAVALGDGRTGAAVLDRQQLPSVLGWKGNGALLVAREEPGEIVLYSAPLDGSARQRLASVAIRSEDFSADGWLVADWVTRG